jgi:plastocyanin
MTSLPVRLGACVTFAATAAFTLAACGGSSSPSPTSATETTMPGMPGMPGMAAPAVTGSGAPVATDSVAILNFAFSPATVTVAVGSTVTWTNSDEEPHTVVAPGTPLKSSGLGTGAKYSYTFTKPGSYPYFCSIHPFMRGTVVVTP